MYQWHVSKYRNLRDNPDWTSVSDIGSTYNGEVLTREAYLATEDRYIESLIYFMEDAGVSSLFLIELEKKYPVSEKTQDLAFAEIQSEIPKLHNGEKFSSIDEIKQICRLILRELIWGKLEDPGQFFVHFGYDYNMYIGSQSPSTSAIKRTRQLGLFVKARNSPYI